MMDVAVIFYQVAVALLFVFLFYRVPFEGNKNVLATNREVDRSIIFAILPVIFVATYLNGIIGFKWDEHYIALGGHYIANGLVPHLDFYIPNGAVIYYIQSIGNIIFDDKGLAYPFAASTIGTSFFFIIYQQIKNQLNNSVLFVVFTLYLVTFFSVSGALWYNQLSALFITVCVVIMHNAIMNQKALAHRDLFLMSLLLSLALLTKIDVAILGILFVTASLVFYFGDIKSAVSVFVTVLLAIIFYAVIFHVVYGVDVFEYMNLGQHGFDSRLSISIEFLFNFFYSLLVDVSNIGIRVIFFMHMFYFIYAGKKRRKYQLDYYTFVQINIYLASSVLLLTSGKGAGYVNSAFSCLSFLTLVYYMNLVRPEGGGKAVNYAAMMLIFLYLTIYYKEHFPGFSLVKSNNMVYYSSKDTIDVLNYLNEISYTGKTIYSSFQYFSNIYEYDNVERHSPYLWDDLGTTINRMDLDDRFKMFTSNLPDVIVVSNFDNWSFLQNFGAYQNELESIISGKYTLEYEGVLDILGTGGGSDFHRIKIFNKSGVEDSEKLPDMSENSAFPQ